MKFTLSWLREHLDFTASIEEITSALNRIGLEVESVKNQAEQLAGFRVGKILEARPHPNADRLQVCDVAAGPGYEKVQVVCGAPNARTGLHVVFAPPGTYIPGSDMTIKSGQIRGEASGGMLCSLRELGLGEESDGIAELPETVVLGQPYADFAGLNETVIDISITPNRGDALSVYGIARDLAAAGLGRLKAWLAEVVDGQGPSTIKWKIDHDDACPYVVGRLIRNVRNGPSPAWLQNRLKSVGLRPISALVDVTNFLLMDIGRPLHVFDAAKLSGDTLSMTCGHGETFNALDGNAYLLREQDLIVADESGVQSLAGIIGGAASSVSEETQHVFIESALFEPVRIALTGRRLGIHTDGRYRFERGVDPALVLPGLEAATKRILDLCGGEASEVVSAGALPDWQRTARLRFEKLDSFGGAVLQADEAVETLEHLGFSVASRDAASVTVHVPSWRHDIAAPIKLDPSPTLDDNAAERAAQSVTLVEGERDLIEEILRIRGLDEIVPRPLPEFSGAANPTVMAKRMASRRARHLCAALGLTETIGFSFVSMEEAALFGETSEKLSLLNPIAVDLSHMRPTPLINLVKAWHRNEARGAVRAALFEVGPGFSPSGQATLLAGLRAGETARRPGARAREYNLWDVKSDLMALLDAMGVPSEAVTVSRNVPPYFHPGKSGAVQLGPKTVLGYFGELHPQIVREMGCSGTLAVFSLNLDVLPARKVKKRQAPEIPSLQPIHRDFAFIVDKTVDAQDLLRSVRGVDRNLITAVSLFDVFEGGNLPDDKKSLGVEVTIQPLHTALKLAEIDAVAEKIVNIATKAVGAELRQ
ncbi:Phenylalanine--tRNA ligase beta subunit [Acetobacteraceae bacterium EV16G]|uniref:Phenylalanine--tRNA ligase beta subunit n=1 Tax=Sorlinia euscelidii TaxID=3081148 RepID=A0ABU7U3M9_9PROT